MTFTQQAWNIALFMVSIERLFGVALSGLRKLLAVGKTTTAAEKALLRDFATVTEQAERAGRRATQSAGSVGQAERQAVRTSEDAFLSELRSEPYLAMGGRAPAVHLARGNFSERM